MTHLILTTDNYSTEVPSYYDFHPKENRSITTIVAAESMRTPIYLQRIANQNGLVFRYNGRTYIGNKFPNL